MRINNSTGFPNWSQLKNVDAPMTECNVTAFIDAAQSAGYDVMAARKSSDPNKRPPDDLYEFLHSDPECLALRDKLSPGTPPNELMEVLALGGRKWLNTEKVVWTYAMPLQDILTAVRRGSCGVVHGRYQAISAHGPVTIDHMNAVVGAEWDDISGALTGFIIDDPYGDYRHAYTSHLGDDIVMPLPDIQSYLKGATPDRKDIILISR